ncbi:MAG: nucleoside recognition protein [Euryarchaeota archaeon]|nr:nucleoside recognition protein [Euryarchaeota archaeon]
MPFIIEAIWLALQLLANTLPFMILGVILAELLVALRIVDKVAFLANPIARFAHLRSECGASFMTAFLSATSANAMLAAYYNKKLLGKPELFIACLMNSFPAIVNHWRYMLPVLLPLLGVVGMIYFLILMAVGFVKTFLIMLAGRFLLRSNYCNIDKKTINRPPLRDALRLSLQTSRGTIKKIVITTIPMMFLAAFLIKAGAFDVLTDYLSSAGMHLPIPASGFGIIAAQFANPVAAYTMASGLLSTGELMPKDIVITLLVGNVLTSITTSLKYFVPYYVGIFGPKIGMQILCLSTLIMNSIVVLFVFLLAWFW